MRIVLLSGDLMVISHVAGAARQGGFELQTASSAAQAEELCRGTAPAVLLVDLAVPSLDVAALLASVRASGTATKVIAFGPHVHEERLAVARAAGCDCVVSRGEFFRRLNALLPGGGANSAPDARG